MGEYGADDFYFEEDEQNFWGREFHFLPFVSIFGASTAGAVNAIMVMSRDGVPVGYAIAFLLCWVIGTGVLLVGANRFFDRPDVIQASMGSFFHRAGSGALCMIAALAAVFAEYKAVDAFAAPHKPAIATHQPAAEPVAARLAATQIPKESVHFRRTDLLPGQLTALPKKRLPEPIAPPAQELVALPKPVSDKPQGELRILQYGESVGLTDDTPLVSETAANRTVKKPAKKKKRRVVKRRKPKNPLIKNVKADDPVSVDSASAPAPRRQIRGLTTESGGNTTGKSAACSNGHRSLANSACRELGAFSR